MMKSLYGFALFAAWLAADSPSPALDFAEYHTSELTCVIGNNQAMGKGHREGYNGIFNLSSVHQYASLFVPAYAGLNLEHYFDGSSKGRDSDVFFEPRRFPMVFRKIDNRTAELRQEATKTWQVESVTRFRLSEPYYIDVRFEFTPRAEVFEGGALGVFWASYINGPHNKSLYFLSDGSSLSSPFWKQFCTQFHNRDSTVLGPEDRFEWTFAPDAPPALYANFSQIRYTAPFYYGRFHNMVWIVVFRPNPDGLIRFTHSPDGGGVTEDKTDSNPAWDFQYVVPDYKVGKTYTLEYRAVYKRWKDRDDVLREVKQVLNP